MKEFVAENVKFEGETLDNNSPDFGARIAEAEVQNAPTIVVYDDESTEIFRASEPEELASFLEQNK